MIKLANRIHGIVLGGTLALFLLMDLFPKRGPADWRYTGSDPARTVLNLGYPLAVVIYDKTQSPPVIFTPLAQLLLPAQFLTIGLVVFAPNLARWGKKWMGRNPAVVP